MIVTSELDRRNIYVPNLDNIQESIDRTYGEARIFYQKEELYLQFLTQSLASKTISEKDIYDICHAIASDLAKCCEMFLKAIYICEHNVPESRIDQIWSILKSSSWKTDPQGNKVYLNSQGMITFLKYNPDGTPIKGPDGKNIYFDINGNQYNENNRGKKIPVSGHQLDRLIELLSPEARLLLETRVSTIPMDTTEQNKKISLIDFLQNRGIIKKDPSITSDQYVSWIEQHKKTFEEARYSGQIKTDVSVEFLFHLATQLKAVAQYIIYPKVNQQFTITDEELKKLPEEIRKASSIHSLLSENLIKLIASDESIKTKTIEIVSQTINYPKGMTSDNFFNMIEALNTEEAEYVLILCYIIENFNELYKRQKGLKNIKTFKIASFFKKLKISIKDLIEIFIQYKKMIGPKFKLDEDSLYLLFKMCDRQEIVKYQMSQIYYDDQDINNLRHFDPEVYDNYVDGIYHKTY